MPLESPQTPRAATLIYTCALGICATLLSASCHPKAAVHPPRNTAVASALEECVRVSGYTAELGTDVVSPTVIAAARKCFVKYAREPAIERWAAHLPPTTTGEVLRQGDRLFINALRKCAEQKGLVIETPETGGSAVQIRARDGITGAAVDPKDATFIACSDIAETTERSYLESGGVHDREVRPAK